MTATTEAIYAAYHWHHFGMDWADGYGVRELAEGTKDDFTSGKVKALRDAVNEPVIGGALIWAGYGGGGTFVMFAGQNGDQETITKANGFWMASCGALISADRRDPHTPRPDFRIKDETTSRMTRVMAGVYLLPNDYRMGQG